MQHKKLWVRPQLKEHDIEETLSGPVGGDTETDYNVPDSS